MKKEQINLAKYTQTVQEQEEGQETLSRKLKARDEKEIGFPLGSVLWLFWWTFRVWMQELDISSRSLVFIWFDYNNIHLWYEFMSYILNPSSAEGWVSGSFWGIWNKFSCCFRLQTAAALLCGVGISSYPLILFSHIQIATNTILHMEIVLLPPTCKSFLVISSASGKDKRQGILLLYFKLFPIPQKSSS